MTSGSEVSLEAARALFARVRPERGPTLNELVRELPEGAYVEGDGEVRVRGVHHDSRRIEPGDLFVARQGVSTDGLLHVPVAIERGAAAILLDEGRPREGLAGVPCLRVPHARPAMADVADAVYGHPAYALEVVGVTGTNGKTTTTHLVRAAVDAASGGDHTGIVGTLGARFRQLQSGGEHTTPESDELARVMAVMKRLGAEYVAMEVSSIALCLDRVRAVRFRVAAFTNFTQDHLDFHGTMEAYGEAKERLFFERAPGSAVVCVDEPFGRRIADRLRVPLVRVWSKPQQPAVPADLWIQSAKLSPKGIEAIVNTPRGPVSLRSPLVGAHNLENLLVTLGIVHALDLDLEPACRALASEIGAPGRLERCSTEDDDVVGLVDYAHTPDALERVLDAIGSVRTGRIVTVFGCGGDRDPKKRGPMGQAVANKSDLAIVTNDNPRTESPDLIAQAVAQGLRASGARAVDARDFGESNTFTVVLDRSRAIELAVQVARPGDTILVAGKGHEPYQIVGTEKRPFDDRDELRRALAERRSRQGSAGRDTPSGQDNP
jgi:UDP-N-acetylmuramoyl-L-alanyl-D-glutamate--2,6-diaminopimelate ligase